MIFSREHRFISFACGRTGTTSVEQALQGYDDDVDFRRRLEARLVELRAATGKRYSPKHVRPGLVRQLVPVALWDSWVKFVFVRNPWDWVLSQHCRHYAQGNQDISVKLGAAEVDAVWHRLQVNNQCPEDESYLQSRFVFGDDGERLVDIVGRFENLQADLDRILDRLSLPRVVLPRLNATRHSNYSCHYTPSGRKRVAQLYARDIDLLGYRFDS